MSTSMASIDDNTGGRYYAYRCSKVKLSITGYITSLGYNFTILPQNVDG